MPERDAQTARFGGFSSEKAKSGPSGGLFRTEAPRPAEPGRVDLLDNTRQPEPMRGLLHEPLVFLGGTRAKSVV